VLRGLENEILIFGFSDEFTVWGGDVFLGYVLFEVASAIIVERWSARKWTARIMDFLRDW